MVEAIAEKSFWNSLIGKALRLLGFLPVGLFVEQTLRVISLQTFAWIADRGIGSMAIFALIGGIPPCLILLYGNIALPVSLADRICPLKPKFFRWGFYGVCVLISTAGIFCAFSKTGVYQEHGMAMQVFSVLYDVILIIGLGIQTMSLPSDSKN